MLYYTGPGVLSYQGKDYGAGDPLPESLPKELVNSLQKKNRVSDVSPKKKADALKTVTVSELAEINSRLQERLKFVEDEAAKAIASRDEQIAEANRTIEALTAQLTSNGAGAGPAKKKSA